MNEADKAEEAASKMLEKLHQYNKQILGDDLNDSIIERVNAAKELRDELTKARRLQQLTKRKMIDEYEASQGQD